jgi:hypothetical protein
MPLKTDPYATPRAWMCDALLCFLAVALILLAILTAPKQIETGSEAQQHDPPAQLAHR